MARIVLGIVLLLSAELHEAPRWAERLMDGGSDSPPWVFAPAVAPWVAWSAYGLALVALFAGTIGLLTRWAWGVAALSLFVVLGLPQQVGASTHYHHLWWLAVVMAVAPCGDALSLDAWRTRRHRSATALDVGTVAPCNRYTPMLRATWLILGLVYFFPGLAKLSGGGLQWFSSENLQHHLWAKWAQDPSFSPLFRIDTTPWMLEAGAVAVVLFEIGFVFAIFSTRWRYPALAVGLCFHAFTALFMNIQFSALWMCYAFFMPWDRWFAPDGAAKPPPSEVGTKLSVSTRAALAVLLAGIATTGIARETNGWPFACYPTFHQPAPTAMPGLEVAATTADGKRVVLPANWFGERPDANRIWVWSWRLGQTPPGKEHQRFLRFALEQSATPWVGAELRKVMVSTHPDEGARVVHAGPVVASLPLR